MDWREYEKEIYNSFKNNYPTAQITFNATIVGRYSKVARQIDVLVEDYIAGNRIKIAVDGKYYDQKIDVKHVEMFLGMLNDCDVNKGLLVTTKGYSQAAINRAHYDSLDLDLDILNSDELDFFQHVGGIPYSGVFGVMATAPFGWILDSTKREGMLATFYQRGLSFEQAIHTYEWMYCNVMPRSQAINLDTLLEMQMSDTLLSDPNAQISYKPTISREEIPTKLRLIERSFTPLLEYTGFLEFEEFYFFIVLFTPLELAKKNIRKLEEVMIRALPIQFIHK